MPPAGAGDRTLQALPRPMPARQTPAAEGAAPAAVLVLLGAPLRADGSPGPALRRRLDCALTALRRDPRARVLATGGVPPGGCSTRPEAVAAAADLGARGIDPTRILVEPSARNTWENAVLSARLLRAQGLAQAPLLLVTDPWHLPRARLAFRAQGLPARGTGCRVTAAVRPPGLPGLLLRELAGVALYLLRWLLAVVRRAAP
jgi:uncharacterized SAM-binding protein YcdF (DUF218 family)